MGRVNSGRYKSPMDWKSIPDIPNDAPIPIMPARADASVWSEQAKMKWCQLFTTPVSRVWTDTDRHISLERYLYLYERSLKPDVEGFVLRAMWDLEQRLGLSKRAMEINHYRLVDPDKADPAFRGEDYLAPVQAINESTARKAKRRSVEYEG